MQLTYTPGGVDDPFSTSNPGYVPGQGPVSPAPPPVYQPPAPAPVYTPGGYDDPFSTQAPSYVAQQPAYTPQPYYASQQPQYTPAPVSFLPPGVDQGSLGPSYSPAAMYDPLPDTLKANYDQTSASATYAPALSALESQITADETWFDSLERSYPDGLPPPIYAQYQQRLAAYNKRLDDYKRQATAYGSAIDTAAARYQGDVGFIQSALGGEPQQGIYPSEMSQSQAQQYVLGAGARTDSDLGYITDVAQQYGYRPTYADVQAAQGQYDQQANLSGLDQSFYNTMGQQNATDMANTAALAQDTNPYLQSRYGQYLLQNNIAPRTDAASGEQFYVQPQHPGLVNAGMQALSTFGSAEQSFGLPKLDVPILGDTIDAALSPLSLASFGVGLGADVANEGLRVGGLTALKQAGLRGIPAIAASTAASEGARTGLEAANAPDWLTTAGAQAAGLAGGFAGWNTPELAGTGLHGLEATSSAVARGADRLGLVPEGGVPFGGMVQGPQLGPGVEEALRTAAVAVDGEGYVTLYHGTTAEGAARIREDGVLRSAGEPDVYVSTDPSIGSSYGDGTVVPVRVKASDLKLDDEFPDGRSDFAISTRRGSYPVQLESPQRPQLTFEGGAAPEGPGAELGSGLGAVAPGRDTAVGRAAAKVAPGMFQVDAGRAEAGVGARPVGEAGTRPGSLLRLPGEEQMPANYTAKDVTRVAARGERAVGSQTVRLSGEANAAFRDLGGMVKQDGNWYLRDVQPSAAEQAAGKQLALAQRVLERPEEYSLTPKQRAAVDKLTGLAERVTNERDAYGAPVQRMTLDEGEKFFWRKGTQDTKGRELTRPSGPSGKRLSVPKTQHRVFDDPMDAVKEGVRYEDPRKTFTEKTRSNLQAAVNQHVANLLDKFAQTPADRVPEALRQRVEGLRQKLSSLKQTTARLDDRTQAAIDQFLKTPNDAVVLDDLRDALRQKVGVNAVGKAGPNFGKDAQAMRQTIAQVKQDLETLAPAWRRAVEQSKAVPPDRATVPQNLAPRLIGRDFAPDVAKTITRYYSKGALPENQVGTVVKGIRILNRTIVPLRAIGDASATLNQLALMAASHPVAFMKNFGLALRDSFKDVPYERWLQKPEVADFASHGGELLGEGNVGSEFQLSNWLQKVPLLRESNKHFERFTNRMRVDAYDSIVKTMERQGQSVDGAAKDQLVNAVNRASGISVSKAGDVEGLAQFAPNFLRAHIENIVKAVSDGTLEGQVARQYLKNLVVLGSTGVIMAAIAQKRDLKEVLTPFTVRDGRLSLNPNFMTVRVGGQDVSVFGSYDSLARLAVVAGDAVNGAIQDRDAMQLFDAIGYAASTKGAPWVQLAADIIKGETFTGADPLSWQEGIKRVIPFTLSQAIEDVQKGMSPGQTALDVGLGFFGAKSNPLTLTEQLNEASGGDFYGRLSAGEKPEAVLKDHPDLLKQYQDREAQRLSDAQATITGSDAGKTVGFNALQEAKAARDTAISDAAGTFDQATQAAGGDAVAQARAGQDFRAALSDANQAYRIRSESAGQWLLGDRVATTDEAKALSAYFDAGDAYRNSSGKVTDYDGMAKAQAAAYAGLSPAGKAAVDAALAKGDVNQPQAVKDYYGALDKLGADGYFDVTSGLADWRSSHPEDDALIRKYGYGESTTKYLDTRSELATQQATSDQMLASGQLSKEQWRNDLGDRKQQLVGAASGAYGTGDFTPTEQTALTGYHSAIDGATVAGKVDWDKVDAWVSSQPQDVQDAINNRATFALSPMAAQYASDMKALDAAGYFDQKDQAWQVFVQKADPEFTGTEAEFWPYVRQFYQDDAKRYLDEHEPGWEQTEPQAQGMIANLYVQRLESAYGQIAGAYNKQWRVQNPQEAQLYYKWFDVGAAETGFAVQQGNNVPVEQP